MQGNSCLGRFVALFILFFLYLNITSWLYGPATRTSWQCGSFRCSLECAPGAVEPADIKVESHQQSSTLFHALTLTGLSVAFFFLFRFFFPFNQQPWSCVPSQFISQAKSSWLSCGNEGSVTPACPGPLTLQGSGWTFTKLSRLCFLWRRARAARACPSPI